MAFNFGSTCPPPKRWDSRATRKSTAASIPSVTKDGATVRVVAGEFGGIRGPVTEISASPLYMDVKLAPASRFVLPIPSGHTALAYVFEGAGKFAGETVESVRMVVFGDGDQIEVESESGVQFMLIAGIPFREPIVPYGPFVMNTAEEIQQTLAELRNGTFIQ